VSEMEEQNQKNGRRVIHQKNDIVVARRLSVTRRKQDKSKKVSQFGPHKQYNICRSEAENVALVPKVMDFEVVTRSDKSEENEMVLLSLAAAALANASSSRRL
jgi:hypothetical protein